VLALGHWPLGILASTVNVNVPAICYVPVIEDARFQSAIFLVRRVRLTPGIQEVAAALCRTPTTETDPAKRSPARLLTGSPCSQATSHESGDRSKKLYERMSTGRPLPMCIGRRQSARLVLIYSFTCQPFQYICASVNLCICASV
jgi:hypothetical protein